MEVFTSLIRTFTISQQHMLGYTGKT